MCNLYDLDVAPPFLHRIVDADEDRAGGHQGDQVRHQRQHPVHPRDLVEQLRHDLVAAQREVSGFYAKGVDALSKLSTQAVQAVVKAATAGVDRLSGRVTSLEAMLAPLPLSSAIVIVQPIAAAGRDASGFVAARAKQAAARIEGDVVVAVNNRPLPASGTRPRRVNTQP